MPAHANLNELGPLQDGYLVPGCTFDGTVYQIALSDTAAAHGSSAKICRGRILGTDPLAVAVKVFPGLFDPVTESLLARELRFVKEVSSGHPRILTFMGTANVGGRTAIVSLYMRNGNLLEYMKIHPRCDKQKFIVQVAEAAEFLHGTARLVHGDLKCSNVLISDSCNAVLADFGLSTFAEKSQIAATTMTAIRAMNTVQFAAPELLLGDSDTVLSKTRESDVYAFGMLVFEATAPGLGFRLYFRCAQKMMSVAYMQDGKTIVAGSSEGSVLLFNTVTKATRVLPHMKRRLTVNIVVSPCGQHIASAGGGRVKVWNAHSGDLLASMEHGRRVSSVAYSPDGTRIASGGPDCKVRLWDAVTGAPIGRGLEGDSSLATGVSFSPDGTYIACGCHNGTIILLDTVTGAPLVTLDAVERLDKVQCFRSVCYSPNGKHLVAACYGGTIIVWNMRERRPLHVLAGHSDDVWCAVFSPSGKYIASGSNDRCICLWDARSGNRIGAPLTGHTDCVVSVAFSASGKRLVSVSLDGTICVWHPFASYQLPSGRVSPNA